jgi:adenosylcobinamide-GDP ribazoletransferase
MVVKSYLGGLGFLTTFPVGRSEDHLEAFLRHLELFPLVGLTAGTVMGIITLVIRHYTPEFLFLGLIAYIAVEGINHLDGLADFADGLMVHGDKEARVKAMKDVNTGVAGTVSVVVYLLSLLYLFSSIEQIFIGIVLAQVYAKLAMLFLLTTRKAMVEGLASHFQRFASVNRLYIGLIISAVISLVLYPLSLVVFLLSLVITIVFGIISQLKFGGISGDILGASNCLVFASSLLVFGLMDVIL